MRIIILFLFLSFFSINFSYAAQVNKVAAVVNGQIITMFDLQKESVPHLIRARINPGDPARKSDADKVLKTVLDNMILDKLVEQEAKRLKVTVSNSEIDNEISSMMKQRNINNKQMEEQLARQKMSVDQLRSDIRKNLLRTKVMSMEIGRKVVVTPQEIKEYYEQHKDTLFDKKGLHMGLMVYRPNVNAASIASQIKSKKISFEEACAKYSIAPNKDKAGDTGEIEWDKLNPEWAGRLNNMRPGDVTELFDLQGHKAQVYLFRPGGGEEKMLTLQEATPQIDSILRMPKARERFDDYSKQLRSKAVIEIRI